ncbi:MAG: prepilin-type N-terminal cleavage/methylation domain-containing protein [Gemmatimonadales bacterium]
MRARGFTLVELVLAVTLLAVGVLAVAASAVPLARLVRRGGAQAVSAAAAGGVIETLRAAGCGGLAAGDVPGGRGLRIAWSLAEGGGLREMRVVATYPWGPGAHSDTYEAAVACSP